MSENVVNLPVVKGDVEAAKEIKAQALVILEKLCELGTIAKREHNFSIGWTLQIDATDRVFLASLSITKEIKV